MLGLKGFVRDSLLTIFTKIGVMATVVSYGLMLKKSWMVIGLNQAVNGVAFIICNNNMLTRFCVSDQYQIPNLVH